MTQPRDLQDLEDPAFREAWESATEQERLRTVTSVADLVEAERADPNTPDDFDIDLLPYEGVPSGTVLMRAGQSWNVTAMRAVAALLTKWGWTVVESSGWETRGTSSELHGDYIGCHHTAAEVDIDRTLRDGRSDLTGPLCNFALHLDGTVVLMAAGTANHFGVASISNNQAWGIEATGPVPLSAKGKSAFPNYRAYVALVVAIRMVEGWGVDRIKGHKEVALPDGRKPDPAFGDTYPKPYPDMDQFRRDCSVTSVYKNIKEPDMPLVSADADVLLAGKIEIPTSYQKEYAQKVYTLEQLVFSGQFHAQEAHQLLQTYTAQSAAREAAMLTALDALSKALASATSGGTGLDVTKDELQAMMDSAAVKAVEDLNLDVVLVKDPAKPTPTPGA